MKLRSGIRLSTPQGIRLITPQGQKSSVGSKISSVSRELNSVRKIDAMDRASLDTMSIDELQEEAQKYHLPLSEDPKVLIDTIMSYHEAANSGARSRQATSTAQKVSDSSSKSAKPAVTRQITTDATSLVSAISGPLRDMQRQILESQQQQQELLQQMLAVMTSRSVVRETVVEERPVPEARSPESRASSGGTTVASMPYSHSINLLASQIPEYGGQENENVELWIRRIEQVARMHRVPDDVILLAASSRLVKLAKRWYDLGFGPMIESWNGFKKAVTRRFQRKILYHVALQKVEARRWNAVKESFMEYAMEKLTLMHNLNLAEDSAIHLLISGIGNRALREIAISLNHETVDSFLEAMRRVASVSMEADKRLPGGWKGAKAKEATTEKANQSSKTPDKDEITCHYCKKTGHVRANCYKLQRKEQAQSSSVKASSTGNLPSTTPVAAVEVTEEDTTIALVQPETGRNIQIESLSVEVNAINNSKCHLKALIDTGSPVSFVKSFVYDSFFAPDERSLEKPRCTYRALNNVPVEIRGTLKTDICLEQLPSQVFEINLHVLREDTLVTDFIIGRDFLNAHKITATYSPPENDQSAREFPVALLRLLAVVEEDTPEGAPLDIETDFGIETTNKVQELLVEVEKTPVNVIDDNYSVKVCLKDHTHFTYAPRRFAYSERLEIRKIIQDLLDRGIIRKSTSPYCARVVPVRKKDGRMRLCVDLRPLNERVLKQHFPFPVIEDCIALLGDKKVFSLLDLRNGFHQIQVDEDHAKYFSFGTPDGQYEYVRLPFGFCESPAEFQKRIVNILQSFIDEDKVIVYIDDIMIASKSIDENLSTLKEVLLTLKSYNFELNLAKCKFLKRKIEYLGYIVSHNSISIGARHVKAIEEFPRPRNVKEVQRFLGLMNFFRKFIKDFAVKSKPLRNLTRKAVVFNFDSDCAEAFEKMKKELTSRPILSIYNPHAETQLHTDASRNGLGAILFQKQASGEMKPIAYFSQALNQAERNYHSFELEMLAIVRSIERFHIYLHGILFTVITDCNALVHAVNKVSLNPRIARWTLSLQNYNFKLTHRAGDKMVHVDALSRAINYIGSLSLERELEIKQLCDPVFKVIAHDLEYKEDKKFKLIDGLVYRKDNDRSRFAVPESMVTNIIRVYHDESAHCGIEKTLQGVSGTYWFPSMRRRIVDHIDNCITCVIVNSSSHAREGEMQAVPTINESFKVLHLDHFGPLQQTKEGFKFILVIVDAFTRFTWLFPTKSTSTKEIVTSLKFLFTSFGPSKEVVTDRGTAFTSNEFRDFTKKSIRSEAVQKRLFLEDDNLTLDMAVKIATSQKAADSSTQLIRHNSSLTVVTDQTNKIKS
ncbi:uncharacterized protein [Mycetomoellerius zeteki]|uniref:uncharacterized protein n=1 Tax=Mycetomoellerius zeteki TaxID=64791 RepID=UPI00084E9E37|nr:PREDICTED: uncharacterized protein LOC108731062 [Trachymyrmex zeteki]